MLLDMRCTSVDPPLAQVVPMVASSEERVESLRRLRPRFDWPERMILIPWPRYVASVKALGVWQVMHRTPHRRRADRREVSMERCWPRIAARGAGRVPPRHNGRGLSHPLAGPVTGIRLSRRLCVGTHRERHMADISVEDAVTRNCRALVAGNFGSNLRGHDAAGSHS
ncbi:MAG: hypothetical protein U0531_09490 [Dehalococcoidia bacterium]